MQARGRDCRDSMIENVPLHCEIMQAWADGVRYRVNNADSLMEGKNRRS
ncbi:MAG: hypothetical protein ACYTEZ_20120 [Planctomycetota bacterium]